MQIAVFCEGLAFACNLGGALLTDSLTIWANCLRVGLDFATSVFALYVTWQVLRDRREKFDYGLGKWENLSALINVVVMFVALIFLVTRAVHHLKHPEPITGTGPGFAIIIFFALVNLGLLTRFSRLHRIATSPVVHAQLVLYRNATVASFLSITALLGTWFAHNDWLAGYFDIFGAAVLAVLMIYGMVKLARQSLSALLDEAVEEALQIRIMRGLAESFLDYDQLHRIRSRRSGNRVFVELFLEFEPELPVRELLDRSARIKAQVEGTVPGAEVWVVPIRPLAP